MLSEKEVFLRLSQCSHLIQTNVEDETFEDDEDDENDENKGFLNGWYFFLDILSNGIISFPKDEVVDEDNEFHIEVRLSDNIISKFMNDKRKFYSKM